MTKCGALVERAMAIPGSFDTGWTHWAIDKEDATGKVVIERDFTSQNAYGMKISSRFHCELDTEKDRVSELSIRDPNG